jgi:uncharacterized membrane protein
MKMAATKNDSPKKKGKSLQLRIFLLSLIGILTSLYALQVEISAAKDKSYVALCDINKYISCSRVFNSK